MRRYAQAGFSLRPCLHGEGPIDRSLLPAGLQVRDGGEADLELADAIARRVRGHGMLADLAWALQHGSRLVIAERPGSSGFAMTGPEGCEVLAATDQATAIDLAWAAMAAWERPKDFNLGYFRGGQDWAIDVCVQARLKLGWSGSYCVRNWTGAPDTYLPSGVFL